MEMKNMELPEKEIREKMKEKEMHLDISSSVLCRSGAPKRNDHHVVSPGDQDLIAGTKIGQLSCKCDSQL